MRTLFLLAALAASALGLAVTGCGGDGAESDTTTAARAPVCDEVLDSAEAAAEALEGADPGATICLADGRYPKLELEAKVKGAGATLRAEHPGKATIAGATVAGTGIGLSHLDVDGEISLAPGTKRVTIARNQISGGYMGVTACASTAETCDDVAIVGNRFQGPFGEDAIRANRYHDGDGDGIGLLVEGNEFTSVRENGNHSDCLQAVWTGDHLVFRKNYLHDNRCQGFFVKDQDSLGGVSAPVDGITVENNLFLRNHAPCAEGGSDCGQPLYLHVFGPYTEATISRNTIWGDHLDSILALREGVAAGTEVADNVAYRIWTDTDATKARLVDNTLCNLEGDWPQQRPGTAEDCNPPFRDPAADDYRLPDGRGVDWAPAEQHYGP